MATLGTDLLQSLMEHQNNAVSSKAAEAVRAKVIPALQELLDQGARVRPLLLDGKHYGYLRGLHGSERRLIAAWYPETEMRLYQIAAHATTLSHDEIESLNGTELQNLIRQINAITASDVSLYPYISAFTSTSSSELLWYGRGASLATWSRNSISIPGLNGASWNFPLLAPPEHARLWAGVAALRERSKKRLDDTFNAAMITRAMVGKGADKLYTSLKKTQQQLCSDILEPWLRLVPPDISEVNLKDGWGHALADDSREGVLREMAGMNRNDLHEQVMAAFYDQQMKAAQQQQTQIDSTLDEVAGGIEDFATILTSVQVRAMNQDAEEARLRREAFLADEMANLNAVQERREARLEGKRVAPQL